MITATPPTAKTAPEASAKTAKRRRLWWAIVGEVLLLSVAAVLILEWFFSVCGVGQQEFLEPDQELGCHHIPGKLVTWRMEGFSNDRISSAGWRDVEHTLQKPPGVTRIALLGDSSTEGLQVPMDSTYGHVMEKQLNENNAWERPAWERGRPVRFVSFRKCRQDACAPGQGASKKFETINFACSSYSTGQEVLQFEHHDLAYNPDIVVLLYNRGDSIENVRDPRKTNVEPRPYFYLDQSGRLQQDSALLSSPSLKPNPLFSFLRRNSRIYGVLTQADLSLSIHEKLYRKLRSWFTTFFGLINPGHQNLTQASYPKPDAMKVTAALVQRLNDDCLRHHLRFILLMFPNTLGDPALAQQAIEFKKLSQQDGFNYIDLTDPFLKSKDPQSLFLQFHFSAAGHQIVADQLCQLLQKK